MINRNYLYLASLLLCLPFANIKAQEADNVNGDTQQDSIRVSLLTCTSGPDLYTMFGHTAIRVMNMMTQEDVVFNYGMFNFNSDNFLYRFIKGETDYELGAEKADFFFWRYEKDGFGVTEQLLNLTNEDKNRLVSLLFENYKPENRVYRYRWLDDNCTTRAIDIIEKSVGQKPEYSTDDMVEGLTARQMLNECTSASPWSRLGVNMVLGSEIDEPLSFRGQMFLPAKYQNVLSHASILVGGQKRQIVADTTQLLEKKVLAADTGIADVMTPAVTFSLLLIIAITLLIIEKKRGKTFWQYDAIVLMAQGLAGVIIGFLFFLSDHPAVGSNWLVVVFNPLPLFWLGWFIYKRVKGKSDVLCTINLVVLGVFFAAMPFLPQTFDLEIYLMVATLLVRAAANVFYNNRLVQ